MSKDEDLYDRYVIGFARRFSGRIVGFVALSIYLAGMLVPLAFGWGAVWVVEANVVGTVIAGSLALGWLIVQIQARDRRHLLEWTTNLRHLTSDEFEWLVGEMFRREGWKVRETGRQDGPDGNIDLELAGPRDKVIVQCKRWTSYWIPVEVVRAFAGTVAAEGLAPSAGILVTLSDFTSGAREFATKAGLTLLDGVDLYRRVEAVRRPEPCPVCDAPMTLSRSDWGWWFRCTRTGCKGKRDLGANPGRAVDVLTQLPERG